MDSGYIATDVSWIPVAGSSVYIYSIPLPFYNFTPLEPVFLAVCTHPLAGLLIIFETAFTETAKHALRELADNPEYQQYNYNISHKSYFYSFNNNKNTK
ncbi:hypothetical protein NXW60_14285 [Bacteroides fragilis]|nr:hypothetical protein NXW60_14285 [Bacteroides fragilis]